MFIHVSYYYHVDSIQGNGEMMLIRLNLNLSSREFNELTSRCAMIILNGLSLNEINKIIQRK